MLPACHVRFVASFEFDFSAPFPSHVWGTAVVGKTPEWMDGTDFGFAVSGGEARGGGGAKFCKECVDYPGVDAGEGGENVNVHFLKKVEWGEDVVVECKGKMARYGELGGGC